MLKCAHQYKFSSNNSIRIKTSDNSIERNSEQLINLIYNTETEDNIELVQTIAHKYLGRQNMSLGQLATSEHKLWSLFKTLEIYKFLIGNKKTFLLQYWIISCFYTLYSHRVPFNFTKMFELSQKISTHYKTYTTWQEPFKIQVFWVTKISE